MNEQYLSYINGVNRSTQELNEIMKASKKNERDVEQDIFALRMDIEIKAAMIEEQKSIIREVEDEMSRLVLKEKATAKNTEAILKEVAALKGEKREMGLEVRKLNTALAVKEQQQKALQGLNIDVDEICLLYTSPSPRDS